MTPLNSKVKIHVVDVLFGGRAYSTTVWISESALEKLEAFMGNQDGLRFAQKVDYYARGGFDRFESSSGPIRSEGGGVFRVGHRSTLFRLLGFYGQGKGEFIVIDALHKRGQKLSSSDRDRIREVADVKRFGTWKKKA